jgi:hypothetical protein
MKKNIITFLSLILLSSCSTPYLISPSTEEALEDNQYRISFRGNSYTSEEKLKNYISKRAAALCSNGNFEILENTTEVVDHEDRTYADYGKSVDFKLRVIQLIQCN